MNSHTQGDAAYHREQSSEVERDAARYRWIVKDANGRWLNRLMNEYTRSQGDCQRFNEAVDQAMGEKE